MFFLSHPLFNYRASFEFDRMRGMLRGRARLERKIGLKRMLFLLRNQTKFRVELQSYQKRAIIRKNVDSAAREHGTGWAHIRNDLSRQNVVLLPRTQQTLAQYEPLAFRSLMELCSSSVPPPPPPKPQPIPNEVFMPSIPVDNVTVTSASRFELREIVEKILRSNSALVNQQGKSADDWMNSWKLFEQCDSSVHPAVSNNL